MKTLRTVMRAEFRRAMPFLPWIAVAQAMTYGAHTRWAMEFSAQMIALIEWLSASLAALVAVRSLWWDAPLRRGHFLATKPMPILPLIAGKGLGLSLMLVAPFGIVEGLVQWSLGIRGEYLMLGILQMTLLHLVALAALFPVVWWWRGLASAICGGALAAAAVIASATVVARQPGNLNPYSGTPNSLPFSLLFIFVSLCLLLVVCSLGLPLLRKWHRTRFVLFAVLTASCFCTGLGIAMRPPEPDETVYPKLVNLIPGQAVVGLKRIETLTASVADGLAERDLDIRWNYSKLKIDRRDLSWMTPIQGDNWSVDLTSFQFREAMAKRFGGGFRPNKFDPVYVRPALSVVEDGTCSGLGKSIDLELLETRYRWEVAVDLPLKEGAEASFDSSRLRIVRAKESPRSHRISIFAGRIVSMGGVQISVVNSEVWMDSLWTRRKFYDPGGGCLALIVDPLTGQTEGLQMISTTGFTAAKQRVYYSREKFDFGDKRFEKEGLDWSHDLRLVVMQPRMVGRVAHAWKSPGKVRFDPIESPQTPPAIPVAPSGVDIVKWVGLHPVPPRDAGAEEVTQWFDLFLPLMKVLDKDHNIPTEAENVLEEFVRDHPDVAILAVNAWRDIPFVRDSISRNLQRDVITRFPPLATNGFIQAYFMNRGWTADLADAARDKARSGQAWRVDSILLSVPEKVGLSEEEWLEYFRMRRSLDVYDALADRVVPRARMDEEVDFILDHLQSHSGNRQSSPMFELAMASGNEHLPRWLHEDLQREMEKKNPDYYYWIRGLDAHFILPDLDLPEKVMDAMKVKASWFLGIDPARFVFDPTIRKYQLRPTP